MSRVLFKPGGTGLELQDSIIMELVPFYEGSLLFGMQFFVPFTGCGLINMEGEGFSASPLALGALRQFCQGQCGHLVMGHPVV